MSTGPVVPVEVDGNPPSAAKVNNGQVDGTAGSKTLRLTWVEQNQSIAVALAFALILLYMAPIYVILGAILKAQGFQSSNFLFSWFAAFMKSSSSTLGEFHKVLFPVMSALSVIAFRTKPTRSMMALGAFILLSLVITITLEIVFDMPSTKDSLEGIRDAPNLELVKVFFTRVQETLMMYFMMLVGISVSNAGK